MIGPVVWFIVVGGSLSVIRLVRNSQRCTTWGSVTLPTESDIFPEWSVEECNFKVLWVCVICGPDHVVLSKWCFTLISKLVTRCRVLHEKLLVPQLVRTSPIIMEPEVSLPYSQKIRTCLYPEPDQSNLLPPTCFVNTRFDIALPSPPLSSKWSRFCRIPHQTLSAPLPHSATCPAHFILLLIIRIIFCEEYKHWFPLNVRILQVHFTLLLIRAVISVSEVWYTMGEGGG